MKYPRVFVAGTFDGLHKGHQFFLSKAFLLGRRVTIGLTSDTFRKKVKSRYETRKKILKQWLKQNKWKADIVSIDDPYEPAASFPEKVGLMVTPDNKHRGEEINAIRKKRGLPLFTLIEVPLVKAEDQQPISSTRMRKGEIDAEGRLTLPDNLRPQLQQPLGLVLHDEMIARSLAEHKESIIITVGDVSTKTLLDAGVVPSLIVIDNKVERKAYTGLAKWRKTVLAGSYKVKSGPGYIAHEAIELIRQWSRWHPLKVRPLKVREKPFVVEIEGEEDLLTLPVLVEAPVGSIVYYGQPPVAAWACGPVVSGLVEIVVTKDVQRQTKKILTQFER